MSRVELDNFDIIDDRTLSQLRLRDTGSASDKLVIDDGGPVSVNTELQANSVSTESLVIGGTLYEEDDNSPINVTGTSSTTFSLANSTNEVIIVPDEELGFTEIQVNGDTGTNYQIVDNADARTTGLAQFDVPFASRVGYYQLRGVRGDRINLSVQYAYASANRTIAGTNLNVTPPITQITFSDPDGTSRDFKARVFRREMKV